MAKHDKQYIFLMREIAKIARPIWNELNNEFPEIKEQDYLFFDFCENIRLEMIPDELTQANGPITAKEINCF